MTDENRPLEAFAEEEPVPPVYSTEEELAVETDELAISSAPDEEVSEGELTDDEKRLRLIEELDASTNNGTHRNRALA